MVAVGLVGYSWNTWDCQCDHEQPSEESVMRRSAANNFAYATLYRNPGTFSPRRRIAIHTPEPFRLLVVSPAVGPHILETFE